MQIDILQFDVPHKNNEGSPKTFGLECSVIGQEFIVYKIVRRLQEEEKQQLVAKKKNIQQTHGIINLESFRSVYTKTFVLK